MSQQANSTANKIAPGRDHQHLQLVKQQDRQLVDPASSPKENASPPELLEAAPPALSLAGDVLSYSPVSGDASGEEADPAARGRSRKVTVLVVEDDASLRLALTTTLRSRGFVLGEAESIEEAVAAFGEKSYDILLTDMKLGEKDAVELLDQLPGLAPTTRPILMSAFASARDYQAAMTLSAVTVLCKPFTPGELFEAIQRAVEWETGFRGSIHGLSLIDMLQMYHYARRSVVIDVNLAAGKSNGRIYLVDGQIVHAEAEGSVGEDALRTLLEAKNGELSTSALVETVAPTINRTVQALLLDLLRLIDEDGRDEDEIEAESNSSTKLNEKEIESARLLTDRRGKEMATEKELQDILTRIEGELSGFIAASIVDLESGMTLAARSSRNDFDLAAASAYNSEMVKQKLKIIRVLNLKATLEDMLLTLSDQIHLIKLFPQGTFLYLAVDKAATNLAIARTVVNRHTAGLK